MYKLQSTITEEYGEHTCTVKHTNTFKPLLCFHMKICNQNNRLIETVLLII